MNLTGWLLAIHGWRMPCWPPNRPGHWEVWILLSIPEEIRPSFGDQGWQPWLQVALICHQASCVGGGYKITGLDINLRHASTSMHRYFLLLVHARFKHLIIKYIVNYMPLCLTRGSLRNQRAQLSTLIGLQLFNKKVRGMAKWETEFTPFWP